MSDGSWWFLAQSQARLADVSRKLLLRLMIEESESRWCARWNGNWGHVLWEAVVARKDGQVGSSEWLGQESTETMDQASVAEFAALARDAQGWFCGPQEKDFVRATTWAEAHALWRSGVKS